MLRLMLGHKENREVLYREFAAACKEGRSCLLLVPEQFTVHAEEKLMSLHPVGLGGQAEVISFKRLARRVLIARGVSYANTPDKATSLSAMFRAAKESAGALRHYAGVRLTGGFVAELLALEEELRRARVLPEELEIASARPELDGSEETRAKFSELSLILGTYRAILEQADLAGDEAETAGRLLKEKNIFADTEIFADGFYSFTPAEYALLSPLIADCRITVALSAPEETAEREDVFARLQNTRQALLALAERCGAQAVCEWAEEKEEKEALVHLRRHLFLPGQDVFKKEQDAVRFFVGADSYAEAEMAAAEIRALCKAGYSYRDIAVLYRSDEEYKGILDCVFSQHGIPVFSDQRTPLAAKPLAQYLETALAIAGGDFDNEDILSHIKTGLTGLGTEDLSRLQRYAGIWEPMPWQWFADFTDDPKGLNDKHEDFTEELAAVNAARRAVIEPLLRLREDWGKTAGETAMALYRFMVQTKVGETLADQIAALDARGERAAAQECEQTWEQIIHVLEGLYKGAGDMCVSKEEFREMWACALSGFDIGRIPTSVDEVLTGNVEHVRTVNKRIVFLLGLNAGLFPAPVSESTVLNDGDRELLERVGVKLDDSAFVRARDEWFFAYYGFTMPDEMLFLSYHKLSEKKEEARAGEFFDEVRAMFPDAPIEEADSLPPDRVSAFEKLVRDDFRDEKLRDYFWHRDEYRARIDGAKAAAAIGRQDTVRSRELARKLTGDGLSISPSALNVYVDCRFKYFCQYILKLYADQKADVSTREMGNFVHDILERVLRDYAGRYTVPIWQDEKETVYRRVDELITAYLNDYLGVARRTARFQYLFGRVREVLHRLVDRLCAEFEQSAFKAEDFELNIGKDGEVKPVEIAFNGGRILIEGRIDRVDCAGINGARYIRIVDYKSGGKKFEPESVYNGYDTQMLLYLFSLLKNGGERYGLNLRPAGVLYYPALDVCVTPEDTEEKTERKIRSAGAQDGLFVGDLDVLTAMEKNLEGQFIKPKGLKSAEVIPEKGFALLEEHIIKLIREMGEEMLKGDMKAEPVYRGQQKTACMYCDYADICGAERSRVKYRKFKKYKGSDLERKIGGEQDGE